MIDEMKFNATKIFLLIPKCPALVPILQILKHFEVISSSTKPLISEYTSDLLLVLFMTKESLYSARFVM